MSRTDQPILARRHSQNTFESKANISRSLREKANGHKAAVLWFTGLSGSGKSTLSRRVEKRLFKAGYQTMLLDGDLLRGGLCGDLGFTKRDRDENIRRVSELSRLFFEQGAIVCSAFISPNEKQRAFARSLIPNGRFLEIHVACPLETCIKRDTKGLYKKAMAKKIPNFTGISAPYNEPEDAELTLPTHQLTIKESLELIILELLKRKIIAE